MRYRRQGLQENVLKRCYGDIGLVVLLFCHPRREGLFLRS